MITEKTSFEPDDKQSGDGSLFTVFPEKTSNSSRKPRSQKTQSRSDSDLENAFRYHIEPTPIFLFSIDVLHVFFFRLLTFHFPDRKELQRFSSNGIPFIFLPIPFFPRCKVDSRQSESFPTRSYNPAIFR